MKRIQRQRVKGWRMPEGAVYVGRPTIWGNPWVVGDEVTLTFSGAMLGGRAGAYDADDDRRYEVYFKSRLTADQAVALYRQDIEQTLTPYDADDEDWTASVVAFKEDIAALAGKDLVCWCPLDAPCHADVLLELANVGVARDD